MVEPRMYIDKLDNQRYYHNRTGHSILFTYEDEHNLVIDIDKPGIDPDTGVPEPLKSLYINFQADKVVLKVVVDEY